MNELLKRGLTGAVFVTVLLGAIGYGALTTSLLFLVTIAIGLYEFYQMMNSTKEIHIPAKLGIIGGIVLFLLLVLPSFLDNYSFAYLLAILWISLFFPMELFRKKSQPIVNLSLLFFGWVYVVLPFVLATKINIRDFASGGSGIYLMGLFILVWTNDTFAYLSGRMLGKTKLFERISPKKTWEGTIGGVVFTAIAAVLFASFTEGNHVFWLVSAVIASVGSIFGDLFESLMKRSTGIKDSGNILPGHGGVLDRFDAVIYALPFYYVWLHYFN